jgi:hypothetical protein
MRNDGNILFTRFPLLITFVLCFGLNGTEAFAWQTILNNPDGPDLFRAVATDSANNVVGAGTTTRANGDRGFVVAKFSGEDGTLLWRFELDGAAVGFDDEANAVVFDGANDVIAVGRIANAGTPYDLTVVKLAGGSGSQIWLRTIDGTANNDDVARAVTIDAVNDIVVAGRITDATTSGNFAVLKFSGINGALQWTWLAPWGDAQTIAVSPQNDIIAGGFTNAGFAVVKLNAAGALIWRQEIPRLPCCLDIAFSVALDSHDDVLAAGNLHQDFAAVKFSGSTGAVIWSRQVNGTAGQGETANRLAVDLHGDVVVAGFTRNTGTGLDFTVVKLDGVTGVPCWGQTIDGGAFGTGDEAKDVAIDGFGDVYATGDIGTDALGAEDLAVVKFAALDGSEKWRYMQPLRSRGNAIALDSANNVVVVGQFENSGDSNLGAIKLDGSSGSHFPTVSAPIVSCVPVKPGLFQVSATSHIGFILTLSGYALENGEIIKITSKPKSGVKLVGAIENEKRLQHFQVGPGEALVVATDEAGNFGSALCPLRR